MTNSSKFEDAPKIRGWLILVAIGVIIAPIRLLASTVPVYQDVFQPEIWHILTTPGENGYVEHLSTFIIFEILANCILFLGYIYMIYLFFSKKHQFPSFFIAIALFGIGFIIADAFVAKLLVPSEPMFDKETIKSLAQASVGAVIWIPYMLLSKRVKATFIL